MAPNVRSSGFVRDSAWFSANPQKRLVLTLHQLSERAIAVCAWHPVGKQPSLPLASSTNSLGIQQQDSRITDVRNLQRGLKILGPEPARILFFVVGQVFLICQRSGCWWFLSRWPD